MLVFKQLFTFLKRTVPLTLKLLLQEEKREEEEERLGPIKSCRVLSGPYVTKLFTVVINEGS
jgi:hypothetical protein